MQPDGRDARGKFVEKLIISNVEKSELICRLLGSLLSTRASCKVQRVLKGTSACLIIDYCLPQHRQCIAGIQRWQIFNMMVFEQLCAMLSVCVAFFVYFTLSRSCSLFGAVAIIYGLHLLFASAVFAFIHFGFFSASGL